MRRCKDISISNFILILVVLIGCIAMVIYPSVSLNAAKNGINLWFNSVLPALLPFFICSNFLSGVGIPKLVGRFFEPLFNNLYNTPGSASFVFSMSITSGYPVGPKLIADMRKDRIISKAEAQRMLSFCSTSGPIFMLGAVGAGMFSNTIVGWIIAISHYLGAVFNGLIFRFYGEKNSTLKNYKIDIRAIILEYKADRKGSASLIKIFTDSMLNSFKTLGIICGYIILFCMITDFLSMIHFFDLLALTISKWMPFIHPDYWRAFLKGLFEMTLGCNEISKVGFDHLVISCVLCSMLISWSGISVHAQVASILSATDISMPFYIFSKLMHSFCSGVIALIITPLILNYYGCVTVFNIMGSKVTESFFYKLLFSAEMVIMILALFVISAMVSSLFSKKRKKKKRTPSID